jgi:hypothetical protein
MSLFVLVFAAIVLGLMDWAQSMMESWLVVTGTSAALLVAALVAGKRFWPKLLLAGAGTVGLAAMGAALLVRFLADWMIANVQPLG